MRTSAPNPVQNLKLPDPGNDCGNRHDDNRIQSERFDSHGDRRYPQSFEEAPWKATLALQEVTLESAIWLSYELGTGGDYAGMYTWLDNHAAKECGSSAACIKNYAFEGEVLESLKSDISEAVDLNQRSRIYVLYKDSGDGRMRGQYLVGKRKAPPWTGYGDQSEQEFDED